MAGCRRLILFVIIIVLLVGSSLCANHGPITMRENANITLDGGIVKDLPTSSSVFSISGSNYVAINATGHKIVESSSFSTAMESIQAYADNIYVLDGEYSVDALTSINRSITLSIDATLKPATDIDMINLLEGGKIEGGTIDTRDITFTQHAISICGGGIDSTETTVINDVKFEVINAGTGSGMRSLSLEGSQARFNNCRFIGGGTHTGHGVRIHGETSPADTSWFRDCYGEGSGTGAYGFYGSTPAANLFYDCVGFADDVGKAFGGTTSASTYHGCLNLTGTSTYTDYP